MKKILILFLLILACSFGHAIVVSEISDSIEASTEEIAQSRAEILSEVSKNTQHLVDLTTEVKGVNDSMLRREHLEEFYWEVDQKLAEHSKHVLALNLMCIFFLLALIFLAKSKKWL